MSCTRKVSLAALGSTKFGICFRLHTGEGMLEFELDRDDTGSALYSTGRTPEELDEDEEFEEMFENSGGVFKGAEFQRMFGLTGPIQPNEDGSYSIPVDEAVKNVYMLHFPYSANGIEKPNSLLVRFNSEEHRLDETSALAAFVSGTALTQLLRDELTDDDADVEVDGGGAALGGEAEEDDQEDEDEGEGQDHEDEDEDDDMEMDDH